MNTKLKHDTILVVEDDTLLLNLLRVVFERKNYKVLTATDGLEAVDVYTKHKDEISLVLSDLGLPKMDGRETYKSLRQINPDVKMILASAYWNKVVRENLIAEGAQDFISKPYSPSDIVDRANSVLSA